MRRIVRKIQLAVTVPLIWMLTVNPALAGVWEVYGHGQRRAAALTTGGSTLETAVSGSGSSLFEAGSAVWVEELASPSSGMGVVRLSSPQAASLSAEAGLLPLAAVYDLEAGR
jgi:hypothetical protein